MLSNPDPGFSLPDDDDTITEEFIAVVACRA
jgi:hypothetical protein